jgi:ribonuclease D
MDSAEVAKTESVEPVPLPLLTLRDGLPRVTSEEAGLARAVAALHSGSGPVAIDTERASGYRYSQRAYLIQIRRAGSGTILIDPIALPHLEDLARALAEPEWVLHAASQDLPCLAELGLQPRTLFDTELAGRLLDAHGRVHPGSRPAEESWSGRLVPAPAPRHLAGVRRPGR